MTISTENYFKKYDLTGRRFGLLVVLDLYSLRTDPKKRTRWRCRCDCGTVKPVASEGLLTGTTVSCGCYGRAHTVRRNLTHGYSAGRDKSGTYAAWVSMWARVRGTSGDPRRYKYRGIGCIKRWLKFENFLKDMGKRPSSLHSLDRKKNNKGYSKKNCRWATAKEQSNNREVNHFINVFGERLTIARWNERAGGTVTPSAILWRLKHGWPKEKAVQP